MPRVSIITASLPVQTTHRSESRDASPLRPPSLRVQLFGQFEVWYRGTRVRLNAPRMALPLLLRLLLHRAHPLGRADLADQFWPDDDSETARTNLRRSLHILTKALPPSAKHVPWVIATADTLQWNPQAPLTLDVEQFELLSGAGADPEAAVALYRGELLESFDYPWVLFERERLREICIDNLLLLLSQYRRSRDFGAAMRAAKQALSLDPWRESIVRQLMQLRYEAGDAAAALAEYEAFAQRLRLELQADPMTDTRALRDAIASERLGVSAGLNAIAESSSSGDSLPFVGRETVLQSLKQLWQQATRSTITVISGPAGIGKTRVCDELLSHVRACGGRALIGRTARPESIPYEAIAAALRSASSLIAFADLPESARNILQLFLSRLEGDTKAASSSTQTSGDSQQLFFEAIGQTLQRLSSARPMLVVLEDMQWAGASTVALLQHLVQTWTSAPIMYVITCREEEASRNSALREMLRGAGSSTTVSRVPVGPLSRSDIVELVGSLDTGLAADARDTLIRRCDGNPLLFQELLHGVRSGKALPRGGIAQAICERVAGLSSSARALAQVAAVAGMSFDIDVVREMSGWSLNEISNALDELSRERIIREMSLDGWETHRFVHHLIHEEVYGGISPTTLPLRHRRAAVSLERLRPGAHREITAVLARHYELSGDAGSASRYYIDAAKLCMEVAADEDALHALSRAIALTHSKDDQIRARLIREHIHDRRGQRDLQRAELDALDALTLDNAGLSFEVLARRCALSRSSGDLREEERLLAALEGRVNAADEPLWRATFLKLKAFREMALGNHELCERSAQESLGIYRAIGGERPDVSRLITLLIHSSAERGDRETVKAWIDELAALQHGNSDPAALFALAHAAFMRQDFQLYRDISLVGVDACRRSKDSVNECRMLNSLGIALMRLNAFADAERALAQAQSIASESGLLFIVAATLVNQGLFFWRAGRFHQAEAHMSRAYETLSSIEHTAGMAICHMNMSGIVRNMERYKEAQEYATSALRAFEETAQKTLEVTALMHLGMAQRCSGDHASSVRNLERAHSLLERVERRTDRLEIISELALNYAALGDPERAMVFASELLTGDREGLWSSAWWPQKYAWAASQIFFYRGDRDVAFQLACEAGGHVQSLAERMPSEEDRRYFLAIPINLEIAAAVNERRWPPIRGRKEDA